MNKSVYSNKSTDYNFDLLKNIEVKSSTNYISPYLVKMGVINIRVNSKKNKKIYLFNSLKSFELQDSLLNFSDFKFVLENNFLFLVSKPNFKISTLNQKIYVSSRDYSGFITENQGY